MARSLTASILALALTSAATGYAGNKAEQFYGATKDGTRKMQHLPAPIRERIWQIALDAPSLDYDALAKRYAADPLLKGLRTWNAHEVGYLRFTSKLVPSDRERLEVLAAIAAKHLDGASIGRGLDVAIEQLAKRHPGVDKQLLVRLAGKHAVLAAALRRFDGSPRPIAEVDPRLEAARLVARDRTLADRLALGEAQIARTLERPDSPLRMTVRDAIAELERTAGDADGRLRPLDAGGLKDVALRAVLENVWARLGRRELSIEAIDAELPRAIAQLGTSSAALRAIYERASGEVLGELASRYADEVIGGKVTSTELAHLRKLSTAQWLAIREATPSLFPELETLPLVGRRLDGVARWYGELTAGRIGAIAFYTRTKITRDQLLVLQNSDPRFAKPEDTKSWQTVAGSRRITLDETLLTSLPPRWQIDVVDGRMSAFEFGRKYGVDQTTLENLLQSHPDLFPPPKAIVDKGALARRIAEGVAQARREDPFIHADEIIGRLNADPEIQALLPKGKLTKSRFMLLRSDWREQVTDLRNPDAPLAQVAKDVQRFLAEQPDLTVRGITERLRALYPRARLSRIDQLRERHPEIFTRQSPPRTPDEVRRADAERLAQLKLARPDRTYASLAEELRATEPRWTIGYLAGLRRAFDDAIFSPAGVPRETRRFDRPTRMLTELASLVSEILPPGFTELQLIEATNRLLTDRGQTPMPLTKLDGGLRKSLAASLGKIDEIGARRVAELVAEYATAARRNASDADVLAAVEKDYPHLTAVRLAPYRSLWREDPARYPSLAGFLDREGTLELRGLGKSVRKPRFLGGWDAKRALVDHADETTREAISRRTDFARITTRVPLLDQMLEDLDGKRPLHSHHVMMVSHLLGTTVALTQALAAAGATQEKMIVVGSPYGANDAVAETLRGQGMDVRVPELSEHAYREAVRRAVDDAVAVQRATQRPFVVLDDGGLVSEILHSDPKYADVLSQFKIVEQTTRGITVAQERAIKTVIVNVARSRAKVVEGEIIGRTVAEKVVQGLARAGRDLHGLTVVVKGFGTIGEPLCELLRSRKAKVLVMETGEAAAKRAAKKYEVITEERLDEADMLVGATGQRSIKLEDMRRLKHGAIIASATSKQVEADMVGLRAQATKSEVLTTPGSRAKLPTVAYQLSGRRLVVLGDGWPINFDGDVDSAPPEDIQITRAAMFAGALQAAGIRGHRTRSKNILPLDPKVDDLIVKRFRKLRDGKPDAPISNPDRWVETLERLIGLVSL